jgi:hypothetical protein
MEKRKKERILEKIRNDTPFIEYYFGNKQCRYCMRPIRDKWEDLSVSEQHNPWCVYLLSIAIDDLDNWIWIEAGRTVPVPDGFPPAVPMGFDRVFRILPMEADN